MTELVTVSERRNEEGLLDGIYSNDVSTSRHQFYVDEPESYGSTDIGPTPFEYLAAALGGCTTITLRMYAERKKWRVDHLACKVTAHREGGVSVFRRKLTITGHLTDAERARMMEIANKCPVHKALAGGAKIETTLTE